MESWFLELFAHFKISSIEEILAMIKELKNIKADKDKFGHLEKKVMDNTKIIEDLQTLLALI